MSSSAKSIKFVTLLLVLAAFFSCLCACSYKVVVIYSPQNGAGTFEFALRKGDPASAPAEPVREGYSFTGWYTEPNCANKWNFAVPVRKSMTLYAGWVANNYTITFITEGSKVADFVGNFGDGITLYESHRTGHKFLGWFDENSKPFTASSMPSHDVTLYARFEVSEGYTVFDFELSPSGCTLKRVKTQKLYSIDIPSSFGNLDVVAIAPEALKNQALAGEIIIPDTVKTIGARAFENCVMLKNINLPQLNALPDGIFAGCASLKAVALPAGLEQIGASAFADCSALSEIHIPDRVRDIGEKAFLRCVSLTEIKIPEGVELLSANMFYGCIRLSAAELPDSLCGIERGAFEGCTELTALEVPSGVGAIGERAFAASGIAFIALPDGVEAVSAYMFFNCVSLRQIALPEGLKAIEAAAFSGCRSLTAVEFPQSLTTLERSAFENCIVLESVSLPEAVKETGAAAFRGCASLVSFVAEGLNSLADFVLADCSALSDVSLPSGLVSVGNYSFLDCAKLSELTLPDSVVSVGTSAFYGCDTLSDVNIGGGFASIGSNAFAGTPWLEGMQDELVIIGSVLYKANISAERVVIPDTVVSVGDGAFRKDKILKEIVFAESVKHIGDRAFEGCNNLLYAVMPAVISVGDYAFADCAALETVSLGASAQSLGKNAFSGCEKLREVDLGAAKDIGARAFMNCRALIAVSLPAEMTAVGEYMFFGCTALEAIAFPSSLEEIGNYAFYSSGLVSVDLPAGVRIVGEFAFSHNHRLSTVVIPDTVTDIGAEAFSACPLRRVTIGSGIRTIGPRAFFTLSITSGAFGYAGNMAVKVSAVPEIYSNTFAMSPHLRIFTSGALKQKSLDSQPSANASTGNWSVYKNSLYDNWTDVSGYIVSGGTLLAYYGSSSRISLPKDVEEIAPFTFAHFNFVTALDFSSRLKVVGTGAFLHTSITELELGGNLTRIGERAFEVNGYLVRVTVSPLNQPAALGQAAFKVTAYRTALYMGERYYIFSGEDVIRTASGNPAVLSEQASGAVKSACLASGEVTNIIGIIGYSSVNEYKQSWAAYERYIYAVIF